MTCVYIEPQVKKTMQQKWVQVEIKLAKGDNMKIAIWWGKNDTLDSERCKSIKGDFSGGRNE